MKIFGYLFGHAQKTKPLSHFLKLEKNETWTWLCVEDAYVLIFYFQLILDHCFNQMVYFMCSTG